MWRKRSSIRFTSFGVTYEDLTGDHRRVSFSSGRIGRLKHWQHVHAWRWKALLPRFCVGVWRWAVEHGLVTMEAPGAIWTAEPIPMIEPDKEELAVARQVRAGMKTYSEMVREQGGDPETHFAEYGADLALIDQLGIRLDSDIHRTSQAASRKSVWGWQEGRGHRGTGEVQPRNVRPRSLVLPRFPGCRSGGGARAA